MTDSRWFKSCLQRVCWCRRHTQVTDKKLLIQRVMADHSWPPVGQSTFDTQRSSDETNDLMNNLAHTSHVSLYSSWPPRSLYSTLHSVHSAPEKEMCENEFYCSHSLPFPFRLQKKSIWVQIKVNVSRTRTITRTLFAYSFFYKRTYFALQTGEKCACWIRNRDKLHWRMFICVNKCSYSH